jgi:hypothetical protein
MTDLRKLSEAEWADAPGTPEYIRAATECYSQFRSGSLIPLSEYEHLLALLAEARGWLDPTVSWELEALLSRINDALAAEPEAKA